MNLRIKEPYSWVGHIPFAFYLVEQLKPVVIVELGTHSGNSFCAFCQAAKDYSPATRVFAIDTWQGDEHAGLYDEKVYLDLKNYVSEKFTELGKLIRKDFNEAVIDFEDDSIDILHIDGLHTYYAVKNDFETWLPKMKNNSLILLHDTEAKIEGFEVSEFWKELKLKHINYFDFYQSYGLGVLFIGNDITSKEFLFIEKLKSNSFLIKSISDYGLILFEKYNLELENNVLKTKISSILDSKTFQIGKRIKMLLKVFK